MDYKVTDAKKQWTTIGYNVTKVIDMNNCSKTDYEVYNKIIPGPNENQQTVSFMLHHHYHYHPHVIILMQNKARPYTEYFQREGSRGKKNSATALHITLYKCVLSG